jgi:hypothetical protein
VQPVVNAEFVKPMLADADTKAAVTESFMAFFCSQAEFEAIPRHLQVC